MTKKIFVYLTEDSPGFQCAVALAEDGTAIASHLSTSPYWSEVDMGLTADSDSHHDVYARYYPQGYQLVNLLRATEDELRTNDEFMRALDIHTRNLSDASE